MDPAARARLLLPPDALVSTLPRTSMPADEAGRLLHGQPIPRADALDGTLWRCYEEHAPGGEGTFLGVAEACAGLLRARRLVRTAQ